MENPPKLFIAGSDALEAIVPAVEARLRDMRNPRSFIGESGKAKENSFCHREEFAGEVSCIHSGVRGTVVGGSARTPEEDHHSR